jgi:Aldehyde dehydrogenase family
VRLATLPRHEQLAQSMADLEIRQSDKMATTETSIAKNLTGTNAAAASALLKASSRKTPIGGKWVAAKSGKTFETINPATEDVLDLVAEGDKADVDEAVKAARQAYETGKMILTTPAGIPA